MRRSRGGQRPPFLRTRRNPCYPSQHENQTKQVSGGNAANGRKAPLSPSSLARGAPRCIPKKPRRGAGRVAAMSAKRKPRSAFPRPCTCSRPDERAKITADAEAVGLSLGGYLRFLGMRMQTPEPKPPPPYPRTRPCATAWRRLARLAAT